MVRLAAVALTFGLVVAVAPAGPNPKDAAKYVNQLKTSKDAKVRASALTEIGKIGQIQKSLVADALPDLVKCLADKDAGVRAAAAKAYGMLDPEPKEAVPALLKLVKEDKVSDVKLAAVEGLGMMGPAAKDATKDLRALVQAKKDKKDKTEAMLMRAAQNALRQINPPKKQ
jgi:HEAT repeat protein